MLKYLKFIVAFALCSFTIIYMAIICEISTLTEVLKYGMQAISSLRGSRQVRLQAAAFSSMQSRNTRSTNLRFVRRGYFALRG